MNSTTDTFLSENNAVNNEAAIDPLPASSKVYVTGSREGPSCSHARDPAE